MRLAIRLDDFMAGLPKDQQEAIQKRAAELIAEEAKLRQRQEPTPDVE